MIPKARADVLGMLKEAIAAMKEKRYADLHAISDHVLHTMAIYQDPDVIDLSVAVYALDKVLETEKYRAHPKMPAFEKSILRLLEKAKSQLDRKQYDAYSETVKEIIGNVQYFTKEIRFYIEDVLHFARIKKGTKLYEHGLSLGKAAELVGVSKWELMPAIGETAIHEQLPTPRELTEKRIKFAEKLFKVQKTQMKKRRP